MLVIKRSIKIYVGNQTQYKNLKGVLTNAVQTVFSLVSFVYKYTNTQKHELS